jgi:hypothetical protein
MAKTTYEVESSNILSLEYNSKTKTLTTHFKKGGSYKYFQVTQDEVDQIVNAESVATTHRELLIKTNRQVKKL